MDAKIFQAEHKDEAWQHVWTARRRGQLGLAFVYAPPPEPAERAAVSQDLFGELFALHGACKAGPAPVKEPRGWLIAAFPRGFGLTEAGQLRVAARFQVVDFLQGDRIILSLGADLISDGVRLVTEGTEPNSPQMALPLNV
jgi:hypothetical protein